MIYKMYSVFDTKAGKYFAPFLSPNDLMAKRNFEGLLIHDPMMKDFKEDFRLYFIGSFDDEKSDLISSVPEEVASGHDFVVKSE